VGNYSTYGHLNLLEVSRGNIANVSALNKFGRNPELAQTTDEDIWDGGAGYVYPTQARVHNVKSSVDEDDSESTGAKTVQVYGLDANYAEIDEIVTMDGQVDVATTNSYLRIFRMVVRSAGTGGANAGNITATSVTDAKVSAQISTGYNQTLMAIYTIPAGKQGLMLMWYIDMNKANITATAVDCGLLVRPLGEVFQIKSHLGIIGSGSSHISHHFMMPLVLAEKSDIKIRANASAASVDVSAGFDILLVDNA
jgi:hypothetical protein